MNTVSITGLGTYLPKQMVRNADLPPFDQPMTPQEMHRIGVNRRGWADESEGIAEMAAEAGRRALERARLSAEDLDLVILANWTGRRYIPEFSPKLLQILGAKKAFGFDISCACAGFLYGLGTAHGYLQNPRFSRALVVASEFTSRRGRPGSKAKFILGDAAGAFILERKEGAPGQLIDFELAAHGEHHGIMTVSDEGWVRTHIQQRELNELAGSSMRTVARRMLDRAGISLEDVDWIVPHSGTAGVQAELGRRLGAPAEKILNNFASVGNVSSASIPLSLDQYMSTGRIRPGDLILSAAVGSGWYSAAALYRAP